MIHIAAFIAGFIIDLVLGDPEGFPHIVAGMGKAITVLERVLRKALRPARQGELLGGMILAGLIMVLSFGASWCVLFLCGLVHPLLAFLVESLLCWQCMALRSLRTESMAVYNELQKGDIVSARNKLSRIVGRDTEKLDGAEITRAAVETVAENTTDGVTAPMLFLAIGGAPLGVLYKAISTMDSMIGYDNEKYQYFGRAAARLDDAANFVPSRITALLMILSAFLSGNDGKNAWRVFIRDRYNHKSPNSAQTEAACAGALRIRLGGDAYYSGELEHKQTIGDDLKPKEFEDIRRANRLLYCTSFLVFFLCILLKGLILWL